MRAREFSELITERRRSWGIGDINLIFDEPGPGDPPGKTYHLRLQQDDRGVSDQERDAILKQLPMVRRRMREFTRGQEFWLYDPKLDKAVGLKVIDYANKIYSVGTVYGRRPSNVDKVIVLPGIDSRELKDSQHALDEGIDPYRLERLDPRTRRALMRMANHADPGSWLSASEAYAMQLGLQYKNRDPQGWDQEVQHLVDTYRQYSTVMEGWRDTLAGLAMGGLAMAAGAHTVKPGDTVYSIARANNTTPAAIAQANRLDRNYTITPGQKLRIPGQRDALDAQRRAELARLGYTDRDLPARSTAPAAKLQTKPVPAAKAAPAQGQSKAARDIDTIKTWTGTRGEALVMQAALKSGIRKRSELAALLAQTAHESNNFRVMGEDLSYSAQGLMATFPTAFPNARIASQYANRPQAIANRAYANRIGNGSEKSGDGWRYRGRGYIQITGRDNYRRAGQAMGLPLEKNPDLASRPEIAAQIAVWYWQNRTRPNVRDFYDVRRVTATINPAQRGARSREENFADFYQWLSNREQRI